MANIWAGVQEVDPSGGPNVRVRVVASIGGDEPSLVDQWPQQTFQIEVDPQSGPADLTAALVTELQQWAGDTYGLDIPASRIFMWSFAPLG